MPQIVEADLQSTPPGTWPLQHIPWTEAETRISAGAIEDEDASNLEVRRKLLSPGRTPHLAGDDPITYVRQLRGDTYDLVARFSPGAAGAPGSRNG